MPGGISGQGIRTSGRQVCSAHTAVIDSSLRLSWSREPPEFIQED
jgi:hypothetical protein